MRPPWRQLTSALAPVWRALLSPGIYIGVLFALVAVAGAYQVRPSYAIDVGSPTDGPFLFGFNTPERMQGTNPLPFRWTTGESRVVLPAVGAQDLVVTLTASGSRPAGQPAPRLQIDVAGKTLLDVSPSPDLVDYSFEVPRDLVTDGSLDLRLKSNAFVPDGDPNPRLLGVVVTRLRAQPGTNPDRFITPPTAVVGWLVGAVALLGLLMALLRWGTGGVAAGTILVGMLAACLLAFDRLWLTAGEWFKVWPQALVAAGLFALLAHLLASALARWGGLEWRGRSARALWTLMMLVFAVRLAGQLHPEIFIVDLNFHVHRFDTVQTGVLLFTIESAEWGGHSTFYLPTAYMFMTPVKWLVGDSALTIRLFTVGIGTLGALLLYYICVRGLNSRRAGLTASALYLTLPMAVLPYSWGITTNVFGEFFALCAFTVLAATRGTMSPRRAPFWLLAASLAIALLSHPGVVQLAGVAVSLAAAVWLLKRRQAGGARPALWVAASVALAAGFAYLVYYRNVIPDMLSTLQQIRQERAASAGTTGLHLKVGGSVTDRSLGLLTRYVDNWGDWLTGGLRGLWSELVAYYKVWPVVGAIVVYAGVWWRRGEPRARSLTASRTVLTAVAWTATILLFALVGWLMNLYVRYSLFAMPVVALGSGLLLGAVARSGRSGRGLQLLMIAYFAVEAIVLWRFRIDYGLK